MASGIKFFARFRVPNISITAYEKQLDVYLSDAIERAATAWLNSIVFTVIPVWSGASRSAFLKLAREVSFPLSVTGISAPRGFINADSNRWGPRAGFQNSTGRVIKGKPPGVYTFVWGTSLFHLVFNETQNANANPKAGRIFSQLLQPGPYNLRDTGQTAFLAFCKQIRLPSPWGKARRITSIKRG